MTEQTTPPTFYTPEDLFAAVALIDHACNQGAFKGWENINKAFSVRERLWAFASQWKMVNENSQKGEENK